MGIKKQGCLNGRGEDRPETGVNQGGGRFAIVVCECARVCVYARTVPTHVFLFLS